MAPWFRTGKLRARPTPDTSLFCRTTSSHPQKTARTRWSSRLARWVTYCVPPSPFSSLSPSVMVSLGHVRHAYRHEHYCFAPKIPMRVSTRDMQLKFLGPCLLLGLPETHVILVGLTNNGYQILEHHFWLISMHKAHKAQKVQGPIFICVICVESHQLALHDHHRYISYLISMVLFQSHTVCMTCGSFTPRIKLMLLIWGARRRDQEPVGCAYTVY